MTQTKFSTIPKENWDSETDIEPKNISPADDWNQITSEVIDVIEKSGEEADTSLQVAQAIMKNALCADFFTDVSTVANTIVLTDNGTFAKPVEYTDGMKVSFLANYSNTGFTTINVNGLGVKNIYLDANYFPLTGTEIKEKEIVNLRYNSVLDGFIIVLGGGGGGGGYIGQFSYGARLDVPEGQLRCDGSEYPASAFPTFFTSYLVGEKIPTVSYATYASEISTNGVCGSFALDEVGETFKTPTITGSTFIAQALASGDISDFVSAGLPNITGKIEKATTNSSQNESGALKIGVRAGNLMGYGTYNNCDLEFDASLSNNIYGNSTTVTPAHIKYPLLVCVANVQVPVSEAQYNGFIDNLALKVNTSGDNALFDSLNNTAKENIQNCLQVDLDNPVSISNGMTIEQNGILYFRTGTLGSCEIFINGVKVYHANVASGSISNSGFLILFKSNVLTFTNLPSSNTTNFYYFK